MKIPCKDCITFPMCKINKVTDADQCYDIVCVLYDKCSLYRTYVERLFDYEFEQIERFFEILSYLCDDNYKMPSQHLIFDCPGAKGIYCHAHRRLVEITDTTEFCPVCGDKEKGYI